MVVLVAVAVVVVALAAAVEEWQRHGIGPVLGQAQGINITGGVKQAHTHTQTHLLGADQLL